MPIPTADPFAEHKAAVAHARSHVREARLMTEAFFDEQPYEMVIEDDPLYPQRKVQYAQLARPLPDRIPFLLSDASKTIRSVLDHIGYTVAIANGQDGQSAAFPFGDNFKEASSRRKSAAKDIPPKIFDLMMAFQPYKGGDDALWSLNKLANTNKHQSLVRVVLFAESVQLSGDGIWLGTGRREGTDGRIPLAWLPPGATRSDYTFTVCGAVRFNEFKGINVKEPAVPFLERLCGKVERIVSDVEVHARRLGLTE